MSTDMFLELTGIVGETADVKHAGKKAMEITGWTTSYEQPISMAKTSTGPSVERCKAEPIAITKIMDSATPGLLKCIWSGKLIPAGEINCYRADAEEGNPVNYLKIKLLHVLLTTYSLSGAEGDVAQEEIGLSVGKVEFIYNPQKKEGGGGAGVLTADMNFITGVYGGKPTA